jgi:hypothetical protein
VPPRVRYGTVCLLIRDIVKVCLTRMSGIGVVTRLGSHGASGVVVL